MFWHMSQWTIQLCTRSALKNFHHTRHVIPPHPKKKLCIGSCDNARDILPSIWKVLLCPNKIFAYTKKCISKRVITSWDIKKFVTFCLYYQVDNFICMKECQEYSYLHGKLCKTGCLQFFSFKKMHLHKSNAWENAMIYNFLQIKQLQFTDYTAFFLYDDKLCYQKCPCDTIYYDQGNKKPVLLTDVSLRNDKYSIHFCEYLHNLWNLSRLPLL